MSESTSQHSNLEKGSEKLEYDGDPEPPFILE